MDITVSELKRKLESGEDFIFIDVREPQEYTEFNIGADLIPLGNIAHAVDKYSDRKNEEVVIHCRSGMRSASAQGFMMANGFTNVRNLTGGALAWIDTFGK
jgi:rhodanese-related sulfurtransferase